MNSTLKNILAVITGVIVGGALNMTLINISDSIIAPPPGADLKTTEGLKAAMHLFEPKHFLMPFLAHALGTLVGGFLAATIASAHKLKFALGIGAWNMLGGIMMVAMLPSPLWFTLTDLILAYIPMAFLGAKLAIKK
jgi:hypothetical protein